MSEILDVKVQIPPAFGTSRVGPTWINLGWSLSLVGQISAELSSIALLLSQITPNGQHNGDAEQH